MAFSRGKCFKYNCSRPHKRDDQLSPDEHDARKKHEEKARMLGKPAYPSGKGSWKGKGKLDWKGKGKGSYTGWSNNYSNYYKGKSQYKGKSKGKFLGKGKKGKGKGKGKQHVSTSKRMHLQLATWIV